MKKQPNSYDLDMLPIYLELSRKQLQGTTKQLQNLKDCSHKPYVLDDYTVDRIIKAHTEQYESMWILLEQCGKWRQQQLGKQQLNHVIEIENNMASMNKANEQILILARYCKSRTINNILKKDDMELVFDLLK